MSARRKTENRLTLFRNCGICGKGFTTTADTPWLRQMERDGKKQANTYFCSHTCYMASYKHIFDGKADERRREREARRDVREKNRRYYAIHADKMRERAKARYWNDPDAARADMAYQRRKRTEMAQAGVRT